MVLIKGVVSLMSFMLAAKEAECFAGKREG